MHILFFELIAFSIYLLSGGIFFWIKYGTNSWGKFSLGLFSVFLTAAALAALIGAPISKDNVFQFFDRIGLLSLEQDQQGQKHERCQFKDDFILKERSDLKPEQFFIPLQVSLSCKVNKQKTKLVVSKIHGVGPFSFNEGDEILYLSVRANSNNVESASSPSSLEAALLKLGHKALYVGVLRNQKITEIGPAVPNILNILVNQGDVQ